MRSTNMPAQLGEFVRGLTAVQKASLTGGALLVGVTLLLFVRFAGTPEYKVLYSGMKPEEAQSLTASLAGKGIVARLSADGTSVSVPDDKLDAGRLEIASAGAPRSGRMGFELFDKVDWTSSDFDQRVNYQRALEGELERTIQTLSGVQAVRVHVAMPAESVFTERARKAKASVIVRMRGAGVSEASQAAIARLVASAVEQLDPEDVTIVDAQTNQRMGGAQTGAAATEDQLARGLIATLEPIVGAERVRVSVQVETDPSTSEQSEEKYDPTSAVALSMQRTEERAGAMAASGVPGTSSNLPGVATNTVARAGDEAQVSKSENGSYAVNRTVRRTVVPAGRVRRVSAAVVVDDAIEYKTEGGQPKQTSRKRTAEEMKQIEELTRAAIGFDGARGDMVSVQNVAFVTTPVVPPAEPSRAQRVQRIANDWASVFRYALVSAVFCVVYLLVIRPVKKHFISVLKQLPKRPELTGLQAGNLVDGVAVGGSSSPDVKRVQALKKQVAERVVSQPTAASRLVQGWIGEGGQ